MAERSPDEVMAHDADESRPATGGLVLWPISRYLSDAPAFVVPARLLPGPHSSGAVTFSVSITDPPPAPPAGAPVYTTIETKVITVPLRAGHTCIACGQEHAACCGQCPHYRPLS